MAPKIMMRATVALAALAAGAPLAARAADAEFCRAYAEAAVNQARSALANPPCERLLSGPLKFTRWNTDFKIHNNWCLTQAAPMVESERAARTAFLRACKG
jgi:hypothetical protein